MLAAASPDQNVYLMKYFDGEYTALAACKIANGFPVALNFSENSKRILIHTNLRKVLLLDPVDFELLYQVDDVANYFWSEWIGRFPLVTKSPKTQLTPVSLGNLSNMVAAGDEYGNVYVWKDIESVHENIGCNFEVHTSSVSRLDFTPDDKRLITVGEKDQCLCQFKIKPIFNIDQKIDLARGVGDDDLTIATDKIVFDPVADETLILELNYCFQVNMQEVDNIEDKTVVIRGSNHRAVRQMMSSRDFDKDPQEWKKPPRIGLILEHIYG